MTKFWNILSEHLTELISILMEHLRLKVNPEPDKHEEPCFIALMCSISVWVCILVSGGEGKEQKKEVGVRGGCSIQNHFGL